VIIVEPDYEAVFNGEAGVPDYSAAQDIHDIAAGQPEVAERSSGR
jgi:hypothetical protein